jgi:transposase
MEACAGAHHWARVLRMHGYEVKLMASVQSSAPHPIKTIR